MKIATLDQIRAVLPGIDLLAEIEAGFIAYSRGQATIPPVGELLFENPPGDVHIKYGCFKHGEAYVVKIASGFYDNPKLGLSSSNGLMLLFDQKTGTLLRILLDEGHLTDVRTGAAGAVAARALAPEVTAIGVLGSGIQAREQVRQLTDITPCRRVIVWSRNAPHAERYADDMGQEGFEVTSVSTPAAVAATANLIVCTTPTTTPLLFVDEIRPGTHITAVGSDGPHKQELAAEVLAVADIVVADSIAQCVERGECRHAVASALVAREELVELGTILSGEAVGRTSSEQITIADLTGVAVQDLAIAYAVHLGLEQQKDR